MFWPAEVSICGVVGNPERNDGYVSIFTNKNVIDIFDASLTRSYYCLGIATPCIPPCVPPCSSPPWVPP